MEKKLQKIAYLRKTEYQCLETSYMENSWGSGFGFLLSLLPFCNCYELNQLYVVLRASGLQAAVSWLGFRLVLVGPEPACACPW